MSGFNSQGSANAGAAIAASAAAIIRGLIENRFMSFPSSRPSFPAVLLWSTDLNKSRTL
jgi:hypothetical protein